MRDRIFRYVNHERAEDYFVLGWVYVPGRPSPHMDHYGIVVEWLCDCELVEPT